MKLVSNAMSPYGRKVMTVIHALDLAGHVELVDAQPRERPQEVIAFSPIGKIPVLVTDDGNVLRDSPVIAEYLCAVFDGERLLPASGAQRWSMLSEVADSDAIIDAAILVRNERLRPEPQQSPEFIAWNLERVDRGMAALETRAEELAGRFDLGTVAIGAAVGYVPRRLPEYADRTRLPGLARFYGSMLVHRPFALTEPA